ncbi:MAG: ribosome biogenesis GTP-binding protein YihA/YsxC [Bacteroidota bacterium]
MQNSIIQFLGESRTMDQCPLADKPEYAFTGRSNVGKSSLINMISHRKELARVSAKPGKTQAIFHYNVDNAWYLVDLPGYGYAKVSKKDRLNFNSLIKNYIEERKNLVCLFILVDARHHPQKNDIEFIRWTHAKGVPIALVFTKADKLSKDKMERNVSIYKKEMLKEWEYMPEVFITSSEKREGREEILDYIAKVNRTLKEQHVFSV